MASTSRAAQALPTSRGLTSMHDCPAVRLESQMVFQRSWNRFVEKHGTVRTLTGQAPDP